MIKTTKKNVFLSVHLPLCLKFRQRLSKYTKTKNSLKMPSQKVVFVFMFVETFFDWKKVLF